MKVQTHVVELKGLGFLAVLVDQDDTDKAELATDEFCRTRSEARNIAADMVLKHGGFEDGELVSEIALRLGLTFKALTALIESSDYPISLNVGIQTAMGYGTLLCKDWTLEYLGDRENG